MNSSWEHKTLGDFLELKRGYDLPKHKRKAGEIPVISSSGTSDYHSEPMAKGPGVVTGRYGTIGEVFYCPNDYWPLNTTLYVRDFKGNDEKFSYYLLKTVNYQEFSDKAAVPGVNRNHLHLAKIYVPTSKDEQKLIARSLSILDKKIELNRQTNATLEAMAQALFKSWFVDFDPVIDNALAAGHPIPEELQARAQRRAHYHQTQNPTPLPQHIATLFPNSFTESETLGWVPEGWEECNLGSNFELLGGHPFKSSEYVEDGKYGVVTIRNVQDGHFVRDCANYMSAIPAKMKNHCHLQEGDVLLSLTGNVGRVCYTGSGDYVLNQRVAKISGKNGIPKPFGYFLFKQKALYEKMLTIAKGTAQQNLSPIETLKLSQVLPPSGTLKELAVEFGTLFAKMVANTGQSETLSQLRDTLLPKLLSGQLRLPDAEQQVAETL